MTILVVALLGAGAVLIASALDNTPIVTTFQKIIRGEKIDWTGGGSGTDFGGAPLPGTKPGTGPIIPGDTRPGHF